MRTLSVLVISSIVAVLLFAGCNHSRVAGVDCDSLSQTQRDSILFSENHHYNVGYNFILVADSLPLVAVPTGYAHNLDYAPDSAMLRKGDDFVIIDIFRSNDSLNLSADSVWLRVGTDGLPLSWVSERQMLDSATPIDPISRFIHAFSHTHLYWFGAAIVIMLLSVLYRLKRRKPLLFIHFRDVRSFYPTVLSVSVAATAVLYGTIQAFAPATWTEFYFYPTINPLGQPWLISLFLFFAWLCVILFLSVIFDLKDKIPFGRLVVYLVNLVAWNCLLYTIFLHTVNIYIGYVLFLAYAVFAVVMLVRRYRRE